jgi:DNA-binding NarL/FixJ family response regulator
METYNIISSSLNKKAKINEDNLVKIGINVHLCCENYYMAVGLAKLLPELNIHHAFANSFSPSKLHEIIDIVVVSIEKNTDLFSQFKILLNLRKTYPSLLIVVLTNKFNPLMNSLFSGVLQTESYVLVREIASSQLLNSINRTKYFPLLPMLTVRQRWVLGLLARGFSTHQAAVRLGMSSKTIGSHCVYIKNRLGISGRSSWLRICMLVAYIPLPGDEEYV